MKISMNNAEDKKDAFYSLKYTNPSETSSILKPLSEINEVEDDHETVIDEEHKYHN